MVQMRLFSIGSQSAIPFRSALIDSTDHSAKVESKRPLSAIEDIVRDNKYRGQKNRTIKISMLLWDSNHQVAGHFYEYAKGNVGATIPIVAYVVENDMYKSKGRCCNCLGDSKCCVSYIAALGTITKVPSLKQGDFNNAPELSLTIELSTYWCGLDYMNWRKIDSSEVNTQCPIDPTTNFTYQLPNCDQLFRNCPSCTFVIHPQQYTSYEFMYDPVFMAKSITPFSCGSCGGTCCSGAHGEINTYAKPTEAVDVDINANFYNAPPKTMVVYEGITGTTDIGFRATSSKGGITLKTYKSKILIDETNALLVANGLTVLDSTDTIVVGDFTYNEGGVLLRNGMILKNGTIVTTVQPVISSDGGFYGYAEPANDLKYFSYGSFALAHTKMLFRRA